jgi:coatomer subunit alpha
VNDQSTRFELAIECGNLEEAVQQARSLDSAKIWARLGTEALAHGNHSVVELAYQKQRNFDKLSFLYLCTGDTEKISRMLSIAENRGDMVSRFQNALFLGDVQNRIQMFKEIDLYPLAYTLAKSHGLTEECDSILETTGLSEDQISMPTLGSPQGPPRTIVPTHTANWPMKPASHSSFEKALLGEVGVLGDDNGAPDLLDEDVPAAEAQNGLAGQVDEEEAGDGWDMGDDIIPDTVGADAEFVNVDNPDAPAEAAGPGSSEADMWARNSPLAADHVAAGSFDTAMQLLNRQVGAVNFKPLKQRFLEIYQASKTYLPASTGLPPLVNYIRRNVDETDTRKILPVIPKDFEYITTSDLQEGFTAMKSNKLDVGVTIFRRILHSMLVNVASSQTQVNEAKAIIAKATEYALAMSVELEQRKIAANGNKDEATLKRQLELSAFFTVPRLEVPHRQLALMAALKLAFTNKQFSSALSFANRVIANGVAPKLVEQVCGSSFY